MARKPQDTSAEEPDGGNLHVRFRGGPGRGNRPGLLNKKLLTLLCLAPSLALAGTAFDGTWTTKLDSVQVSGPPVAYEISQGMYRCASCVPQITVKADGTDQKVSGHDYYDSMAIRIVNAHAIESSRKKGGKIIGADAASVSADGKTLTELWVDYTGAQPPKGTNSYMRLTAGTAGTDRLYQAWRHGPLSWGHEF